MDYYKYQIRTSDDFSEVVIAFLSELPFDTFQETEHGIEAFIPKNVHTEAIQSEVQRLAESFNFSFQKEIVQAQNWNKVWESNFQPIIVGDFCGIRADFHEKIEKVKHEIRINPKMAFGTGHHATTFMMIQHMESLDFEGKKVFDYGCGTGILAILAAQLGAKSILAIDIEQASYENTLENAEINGISCINCQHATLEDLKKDTFDIILANINRNVILNSLSTLYTMLVPGGKLMISGFIENDIERLLNTSQAKGFLHLKTKEKDNWVSMILQKS